MTKDESRELLRAVLFRFGIVSGGILGGFAVYWIGAANVSEGEVVPAWQVAAGAAAGVAVAWAVLAWLTWRQRGAGLVGGILTAAAFVVLAVRFLTRTW